MSVQYSMCFSPLLDLCTLSPIFCLLSIVDWNWLHWMTEKGGKELERETLESGCALGSSRLFFILPSTSLSPRVFSHSVW